MKLQLLALIPLAAVSHAVHAQQFIAPPDPEVDKLGCIGFSYDLTLSHVTHTITSMVVSRVDSLSPSVLAGLRSGDSVTTIDGKPIKETRGGNTWRTPPGTHHTLKIRRGDRDLEIAFASGKLGLASDDPDVSRPCRPVPTQSR
ncbi:MAG: hypothetical protein JWM95_2446 [Gemmatimonadetes bacterium]|nr:hypothetical protein [Gemmatimonadota bacterium]